MINRILEVCEDRRYLSVNRGFIEVKSDQELLGRVPIDDVAVLLLSAQGVTITKNLLSRLAEKGAITVICGNNYLPQSMVLPIANHSLYTKNIKSQIQASLPFQKRIWQQIVIQKIRNQALSLKLCGKEEPLLLRLAQEVKSGDSDNREGVAAKLYWSLLFGESFKRDREAEGINALLNYGYAVMRASMARAICSSGLLPSLGVNHHNNYDSFCLADDFFEIYRPIIDYEVYGLSQDGNIELTPEIKNRLINLLWVKVDTSRGASPLFQSMQYMVASYVHALEGRTPNIELPQWGGGGNERFGIE